MPITFKRAGQEAVSLENVSFKGVALDKVTFKRAGQEAVTVFEKAPTAPIWGVSGLGNEDPILMRTFDNVGKNYMLNMVTGEISTDFDTEFNFETVVQDGNTMIKIPTFYKRFDTITDNQITAFSISKTKVNDNFVPYPCFVKQDGSGTVMDYILISKGKATGTSSKATCDSGSSPLVNVTRAQMRTAARANGAHWQQYDWMVHQLIRDLFCVVFATTNTQSIFSGTTSGGEKRTVGTTWNMSSPCGWDLTTKQCRFFGLEDIFGNVWDWCDGITFDGASMYSTTNPSQFSDSVSNMTLSGSRSSGGWFAICSYNTNQPFLNFPKSTGPGSESTYYCDMNWSDTAPGYHVCMVGTGAADGTKGGLWAVFTYHDSAASGSDIGGRLVYRPV